MGASLENRGECGRIYGNYRYKLALSREVLPSGECLDGGRQRSRRVVCYRPSRQERIRRNTYHVEPQEQPRNTRVWVLQGHQEVGTTT